MCTSLISFLTKTPIQLADSPILTLCAGNATEDPTLLKRYRHPIGIFPSNTLLFQAPPYTPLYYAQINQSWETHQASTGRRYQDFRHRPVHQRTFPWLSSATLGKQNFGIGSRS